MQKKIYLHGIPLLQIAVHSDQPGFDLCLALSVVSAKKETVTQLSTGFLRILGEQACTKSYREVLCQPLVASIEPGEQLRISIAGAAWPAIGVNPGSETLTSGPPKLSFRETTLTLSLPGSLLKIKRLPINNDHSSSIK